MPIERGIGRILSADLRTELASLVGYEITTTDEEFVDASTLAREDVVCGFSEREGRILTGGQPPAGVPIVLELEDRRRWPCTFMNGRLVNRGEIE
jgi:hypothetical protein